VNFLPGGFPSREGAGTIRGMDELFDLPPTEPTTPRPEERGRPRLQRPRREQITLRPSDLESLLPPEHRARLVWAFVDGLDLSAFHERVRATEGHSGRPPIDPAILVSLWLYATLEGVGSARALDRLCDEHDAYRWICGGVGVNYHTLADFRVAAAELLDGLLAQSVAALLATGEVTLARVAHDGVRVRASAGAGSYRGRRGLAALPELEAAKARARARGGKGRPVSEARVSTTDPEARVMRMGDGGYRPAYNGQLTTDAVSGLVCGVAVTNVGSDQGQLGPALDRLERAFGRRPAEMLADGGYVTLAEIERLEACGTALYAPPMTGRPRADQRPHGHPDSPAVDAWRARMATNEGQLLYRLRAATAEWVNALARNRGLAQYRVRGLEKVRSVLLWFALAHNLDRTLALRAGAPG